MLVPSIFNGNLFDDFMEFSFPDIDRELYGKRAQNIMKTDVKELDNGYEVMVDLPGFNKEDIKLDLKEAERGACKGYGITWRPQTRRTFQTAAFEKAHPNIDLSPFYKTSESRVLRITVNKEAI